jgi:hypothetical protein
MSDVTTAASAPTSVPPGSVLPGIADLAHVLARDDDLILAIVGGQAYPQGFTTEIRLISVAGRLRPPPGHGGMLSQLQLTVEFSDGRRGQLLPLTGSVSPGHEVDLPSGEVLVVPRQGAGDGSMWRQEVWVSPLPPAGPLRVGVRSEGLPETWTELSGDVLRAAAERAEPLWVNGEQDAPVLDPGSSPTLPPPGVAPAEPEAAEHDIRAAFAQTFTSTAEPGARLSAVQDGAVLAGAAGQARRAWPVAAATMRVALGGVVFLDPVRAAVQYQLRWEGGMDFGPQLGYAVLDGGVWKVARDTYCTMLGWAGVACPPPPPPRG